MKKFIISCFIMCLSTSAWGFYDFCESPADYNTFPQAYDVRTEYWKDIPNYETDDIKYNNLKNEHPIFPLKFKKSNKNTNSKEQE